MSSEQYGVRFMSDGSEAWRWNGRTSRIRAELAIARYRELYPRDRFELVRRQLDELGPGPSVLLVQCTDCDRELKVSHGFTPLHTRPHPDGAREMCPGRWKYWG